MKELKYKKGTLIIIFILIIILEISFVNAVIDPARIFCKDAGYERVESGEGTYCISPEGTKCTIWEYCCKCADSKTCWSCSQDIDYTECELPCPEISCIREGETNTIYECCEGLKCLPFDKNYINVSNGSCEYSGWTGPQGCTCSDCGNNICEEWENKCNCPEDCEKLNFMEQIWKWIINLFKNE